MSGEAVLSQHKAVLQELCASPRSLTSPRQTNDRSNPVIDPNVHLEKFPKEQLLAEVQRGVNLHHVDAKQQHDASAPVIEKDVVIKPSLHGELMQEVRAMGSHHAAMSELKQAHEGGLPLKHVETVDKAAPHLSPEVHLGQDQHGALLQEVLAHKPLAHVDPAQQHDTSGPQLQQGQGLDAGPDPRAAVLEEVRSGGLASKLAHVAGEQVADRSAPVVTKTAAMRVVPHQADQ